jgi:hypothetical protein
MPSIVLPPKPINQESHTSITNSTFLSDDDTKATISEITNTVKTDSIQALQQQELENAKQIIETQRLEIQQLKDDQEKADAKYTTILSMMNNRLQEQDSENATMKQEIATMLIQQQNTHTADMQALYDRMMLQMTTMFTFPQQPASFHACEPYTQESTTTNSASNNNLPQNTKTVKDRTHALHQLSGNQHSRRTQINNKHIQTSTKISIWTLSVPPQQSKMSSDPASRLTAASAAWTRLFNNTRPLRQHNHRQNPPHQHGNTSQHRQQHPAQTPYNNHHNTSDNNNNQTPSRAHRTHTNSRNTQNQPTQ